MSEWRKAVDQLGSGQGGLRDVSESKTSENSLVEAGMNPTEILADEVLPVLPVLYGTSLKTLQSKLTKYLISLESMPGEFQGSGNAPSETGKTGKTRNDALRALLQRLGDGGSAMWAEIYPLLRSRTDFQHRVAISGGVYKGTGSQAERQAVECLIIDWINDHPPEGPGVGKDAKMCAACDIPLGIDAVPLADKAWVHDRCWSLWQSIRWRQGLMSVLRESMDT